MPKLKLNWFNHWTILGLLVTALLVYWKFFSVNSTKENFVGKNTGKSGKSAMTGDIKENFDMPGNSLVTNSVSNVGQCSSKKGCAENKNLLPVMNPLFNMREICKQCILLEDHLFQTRKRCEDCCKKHFLTIEGLAEEAITLDKENQHKLDKLQLPDKIRDIQKCYLKGDDPVEIAQKLRQIRKPLMNQYFDQFD